MFEKVADADFIRGEHTVLSLWQQQDIFQKLRRKNAGQKPWSFLDGPITANNPMGVHHAWGRTYKDAYQRFFAMTGRELRYQNGFDCQGLWVEVEVEKELGYGTKRAIAEYGIDNFVRACKQRVLRFAARQTEQSIRLGYWMDWDRPDELRKLADTIGQDAEVTFTAASGAQATGDPELIAGRLGNPEWGGSYFTFATENNETIWAFLKKCYERGKVYLGYDVMPWSGRAGSAYSQMEVADGRRLSVHKSVFVRLPLKQGAGFRGQDSAGRGQGGGGEDTHNPVRMATGHENANEPPTKEAYHEPDTDTEAAGSDSPAQQEYLLVWTTTPWTLTSNVAAAVNPDLDYVRLQSKRDGAIYYFAQDNLEFQRLGREFKEGFGRPEWTWPAGVPKLKTLSQIFKEQGGYEVLGTVKGAEMVGWEYTGPFDDLPAQQQPGGWPDRDSHASQAGNGTVASIAATECHRVIDGGRDFKGNPNVVAGEGTGIVHIAPGCGDIDHQIGRQLGLVEIAPLAEDSTFIDGFGDFTGRSATDPATAERVFEVLREKGMLLYVESYPHIYPHCWRTGDELVFRLVDEWFINMDWRDEIMRVVEQIRWLPDSIQGRERELEWLTNMRDWMVSKKRFWGLALPIWVDEASGDFEVMGSLAELKARATNGGEGWDEFEGHTPHRPWIDKVKIRNPKTGNLMSRIVDVGNPWLDAGIVPFSTLQFNTNTEAWQQWYPADLVTECFPGQFRNWFYALLSMATMMDGTPPFRTLLGHRLVMNEEGQPMHKSDGTAIWFEEAAEQLGVDTIRWMYLAQNPATDLRFGMRHPDQSVTLETPEGPIDETREGLPTRLVTSRPADEIRRQVLIPLWNSYAFFVNYARLDEFDPHAPQIPVAERPEIDRWMLSDLQRLIEVCRREFAEFNAAEVCRAAGEFIDDLSSWYIRRNRRRFWSKRGEGDSRDKQAAYQTLYQVLLTLTKLLAPCIPFLAERMYQNLSGRTAAAQPGSGEVPESVHLCDYPQVDPELLDPELNERMELAQAVVRMGHALREGQNLRVRQPLAELQYACANPRQAAALSRLEDVVKDELNVKQMTASDHLDELVRYSYKPNLKTLGPKYGKLLGVIRQQLPQLPEAELAPLRRGVEVTVRLNGHEIALQPDDVMVSTEQAADWITAADRGIQIALSTVLTPALVREGMSRDFVRQVQQLRKDSDLEIQDRIRIHYSATEQELTAAIEEWGDYIRGETLADAITASAEIPPQVKASRIGELEVPIWIARA